MHLCTVFLVIICSVAPCTCPNAIPSTSKESSELVAVAVMFRHGDRSPLNSFPNDPYFNQKYWPMGFGQLTSSGVRRAHSLGQWFRKKYSNFVSETYIPKETYVWSTDVDRTLATAQAVLSGLFPPKGFQIWNENIPWQPIPVHTTPRHKDDLILEKRYCPKYQKLFKEAKRANYDPVEKQYQEFIKCIQEKTGWQTVTLDEVQMLRNQLHVFRNYNESFIPEWSKSIYPKDGELDKIANVPFRVLTSTKTLARLRIGPFFNKLFTHFDNFTSECSSKGPKFFVISCHDTCLVAALDAMGSYDLRPIEFTDTVIWELRKSKDGKFFVNLFYKHQDVDNKKLEKLNIYNCEFDCSYEKFKKLMNEITIDINDWEKECYRTGSLSSLQ